jgi:hypothetical protein
MALCEHCRAGLEGPGERLPPPWFDHDHLMLAGRPAEAEGTAGAGSSLAPPATAWVANDSLMALLYSRRPDNPPTDQRRGLAHDDLVGRGDRQFRQPHGDAMTGEV